MSSDEEVVDVRGSADGADDASSLAVSLSLAFTASSDSRLLPLFYLISSHPWTRTSAVSSFLPHAMASYANFR